MPALRNPIIGKRAAAALVGGGAAAVLLLSACGGPSNAMSMPSGAAAAPAASTAPMKTDHVSITNFAFSPAAITVVAGTTVTWTNADSTQHDVSAPSVGLKSSVLSQGDTYTHTFTSPGTYDYICSIHPFMHGTVVVTAP
jgi:plastocyanin